MVELMSWFGFVMFVWMAFLLASLKGWATASCLIAGVIVGAHYLVVFAGMTNLVCTICYVGREACRNENDSDLPAPTAGALSGEG